MFDSYLNTQFVLSVFLDIQATFNTIKPEAM